MNEPAKKPVTTGRSAVRSWSGAIWVTLIVAGLSLIAVHGHIFAHGHEQFIAAKTLFPNHRVVEGDIAEAGLWHVFLIGSLTTRDDFNGRYVEGCVDDKGPIEIEKTAGGPEIVTEKDKSMLWIPLNGLPAADVATLDVQRELDVCNLDGQEACGGAYQVLAIACEGKAMAAETCSAAVKIAAGQRRRLLLALDEAERTRKPEPTTSPEPTTKPEPTTPAIAGNTGSKTKAGAVVKPRRISAIHVMIHRSAIGTTPAAAALRGCPTPAAPKA